MEDDFESVEREYYSKLSKGRLVAEANGMSLTRFKNEAKQGLMRNNNEEQWTFDYESYLFSISNGVYESPAEWAEQYYMEYWDFNKDQKGY